MAKLVFDDGKEVELSQETTDRLRKELIKDDGQLIVDRFRAVRDGHSFVRIALMPEECDYEDVWDELTVGNAASAHLLLIVEVEEIIEGLQRLIGK